MTKRQITKREEQAYRLVSPDFGGLSTTEAAKKMGITTSALSKLLKRMSKKAPQLFPILTERQNELFNLLMGRGLTVAEAAEELGISYKQASRIVAKLYELGLLNERTGKTLSYEPHLDDKVIRKF